MSYGLWLSACPTGSTNQDSIQQFRMLYIDLLKRHSFEKLTIIFTIWQSSSSSMNEIPANENRIG